VFDRLEKIEVAVTDDTTGDPAPAGGEP
jgi:hypothetical protein